MSLWEGVPLREVISLTRPKENVRRVYYQSHHGENLPPFQSSLPLSQVLEAPPGQMPVILTYKMNGELIPASHGGPVRMVVPGAYGSKSIKWLKRVVLTNDYKSNDSAGMSPISRRFFERHSSHACLSLVQDEGAVKRSQILQLGDCRL